MKDIKLKVWPYIENYIPALVPVRKGTVKDENNITVDLSNLVSITSSGVNFTLLNLLKFSKDYPNRKWNILSPNNSTLEEQLKNIGFFNVLTSFVDTTNLFTKKISDNNFLPVETISSTGRIISFPIYTLQFSSSNNRRLALQYFRDNLFTILNNTEVDYKIAKNIIITVLNEIAKNSADHTSDNALFGIDLIYEWDGGLRIQFSFGDLGIGICQSVKDYITKLKSKRASHMSLYEAYYLALQSGFSTSTSPSNKGIGMSMIYNSAKELGMDLHVFDAESMGKLNLLEFPLSHTSLRKIFYEVGNKVGFYYFGNLLIEKK